VKTASGFIYYVSLTGITGAELGNIDGLRRQVEAVRKEAGLPVCVGFGIKTAAQSAQVAGFADGVVIGSQFVSKVAGHVDDESAMINAITMAGRAMRQSVTHGGKA